MSALAQTAFDWGTERRYLGPRKLPGLLHNLIDWMLRTTGKCWASRKWMAAKIGVSVATINRWWGLHHATWGFESKQVGPRRWNYFRSKLIGDFGQTDIAHGSKCAEVEPIAIEAIYTSEVSGGIQPEGKRSPEPTLALAIPPTSRDRFEEYIGIFMAARKPLTEHRVMIACRLWISVEPSAREQQILIDTAFRACRAASEPRYIPDPSLYLRRRRDGNMDLPTVLPGPADLKPEGKIERAIRGALDILKRRGIE